MKLFSPDTHARSLSTGQANYALAVFLLAYILSFIDRQILSLMVDPIRSDLGLSDLQIGLLQGLAFALLYAFLGIPFGMWADRRSRKWIIISGIIVWSIATAMCGVASSYAFLFMARMCVGIGEATLSPAAHSFMSDAFPRQKLARAMAIYTLGITIGGGAALMIGGSVVDMISKSGGITVPLIGELRSWQAAFLAVSIPGLPIALLALATREPPRSLSSDHNHKGARLSEIFAYLIRHRRTFIAIYFSSSIFGIMGYGMLGWYPTLLIRNYGLAPGEAGTYLGAIYLFLGSAGTVCGGIFAERLALRGKSDANLRIVMWLALTVLLPAVAAPLMPSAMLVLLCFAPACFFLSGYFCCSIAAIQLATPASMRGTNAALFLLSNSLIGLTLGSVAVPLIDRLFFGGTGHIGPALATIAGISCIGTALLARYGLSSYGALVEQQAISR